MFYRSHKWVMTPHTSYEIRREMRVRESVHTVMLFDKKYMNIDTGKFDLDKLPIIASHCAHEMIDDRIHNHMVYPAPYRRITRRPYIQQDDYYAGDAWFVPKDNDWDEK